MDGAVPLDRDAVIEAIRKIVGDAAWAARLADLSEDRRGAVHIAVMNEPYLSLLLEGKKTIESRFSRKRVSPFEAVAVGDLMVLKEQSGPLVGIAEVEHVGFYELDPPTWKELRERFEKPLCATDDDFWTLRAEARYATLLGLRRTLAIESLRVKKTDRRGWVRLECSSAQQALSF
jgi:ASC-1-like (ASCH) protein